MKHLLAAGRGASLLTVSPTGSGKSFMEAHTHLQAASHGKVGYVIAPTIEILSGIYAKATSLSGREFEREDMEAAGFWTVKTLLNRARDGTVPVPDYMIFDEAHHSVDNEHQELWALLGCPPRAGWTATDYRGTPAETKRLRQAWPTISHALSLADAVRTGVIAAPTWDVWPLLNDDLIQVVNGEFVASQVASAFKDALPDLVSRIARFYDPAAGQWDRPTMMAVTSVKMAKAATEALLAAGLPAVCVTGESTNREETFAAVVACKALLVQISVVGEGVDLPIRRLIDCAPTLSPVRFQQRLGRITRPTDTPPEYIACCHNLTRHAYLWAGIMPSSAVRLAQTAFGERPPTRRNLARAIGLEGFGKFTVSPVPLAGGITGAIYSLQSKDGLDQYAVILSPLDPAPLYATRRNELTGRQLTFTTPTGVTVTHPEKEYGKWKRVESFPDLTGVASTKAHPPSPGMMAWWRGETRAPGAEAWGLDPTADVDARSFQALPILANTRTRILS